MWTLCCHRSLLNPLCPPFQPPSPLMPSSLSDCREGKYLRITLSLWLFFFFPLFLETASPWGAQGEIQGGGHQVCYPAASDCRPFMSGMLQVQESGWGAERGAGWGAGWVCGILSLQGGVGGRAGGGGGKGQALPCLCGGRDRSLLSLVHPPLGSSQ